MAKHKHEPDWSTTRPADGAPDIIDVWCKCGTSGSFHADSTNPIEDIQWSDDDEEDNA